MNPNDMPVTPEEDEEWGFRIARLDNPAYIRESAVIAAQEFVQTYQSELHIMTLRKVYEMGYIAGVLSNKRRST